MQAITAEIYMVKFAMHNTCFFSKAEKDKSA